LLRTDICCLRLDLRTHPLGQTATTQRKFERYPNPPPKRPRSRPTPPAAVKVCIRTDARHELRRRGLESALGEQAPDWGPTVRQAGLWGGHTSVEGTPPVSPGDLERLAPDGTDRASWPWPGYTRVLVPEGPAPTVTPDYGPVRTGRDGGGGHPGVSAGRSGRPSVPPTN